MPFIAANPTAATLPFTAREACGECAACRLPVESMEAALQVRCGPGRASPHSHSHSQGTSHAATPLGADPYPPKPKPKQTQCNAMQCKAPPPPSRIGRPSGAILFVHPACGCGISPDVRYLV